MNAEQSPSPQAAPEAPRVTPRKRGSSGLLWLLPMLILGGVLGWHVLDSQREFDALRHELASRLADSDNFARKDAQLDQDLLSRLDRLENRLGKVEARQAETRDQEEALQALFQNVARGREEAELLEIEQAVTLAVQQLQLAGNVPVALLALRTADAQLARMDKARLLPLRKALAADISHLNELPLVDLPGISLRLEEILKNVGKFPFAALARPGEEATGNPGSEEATAAEGAADAPPPWWQLALSDFWQEIRSMVRIQRFDREEPPLLAPGQGFFLRENLKLRLLSARLALFARDQWTFRNELHEAHAWISRYFIADDPGVKAALAQLNELAAAEIVIELPDLRASQQALMTVRENGDKR